MQTSLRKKVAVITGAGQGIGLGIAQCMARAGADVVLADIDRSRLDSARAVVAAEGHTCSSLVTDVRNDEAVARLVVHTLERHDRLDILVNNAGVVIVKPIDEQTEADWDAVVDVNLKGSFLCAKHALPALESSEKGAIINLCSIAAYGFTTPHVPYSASKSGIIAFTRDLAFELAPRGIRVNAIAPGPIETPMFDGLTPAQKREHAEAVPLGRLGRVDDVGHAAVFLASDAASFVTGAVLPVSGGTDLKHG